MLVVLVIRPGAQHRQLIVERRRGLPFSRFHAKLVLALLGLTIVPSVLVLIVGGELIRSSTERWLRVPIDDVLRLSTQIAGDYYREREARVEANASRIARLVR
jgi:two-component system nitrogen regulation sensor histidine kinase NtrY